MIRILLEVLPEGRDRKQRAIGASDLVPEVNKHRDISANVTHFVAFVAGIALLWAIRQALEP